MNNSLSPSGVYHPQESHIEQRARKKVGLIVPSPNTIMEPDLSRHLPPEVSVHTSRMLVEGAGLSKESESLMLDEYLPRATKEIASLRPDVVVFGCTSAGALRGQAYEENLCDELSQTTKAPTISVMAAVVEDFERLSAHTIAVLTPYPDEVNENIRRSIEEAGFQVACLTTMGATNGFAIAEITPDEIVEHAREHLQAVEADCLFVACANLRAVEAIDDLREVVKMPVVTSIQAVIDNVRRLLGLPVPSLKATAKIRN
jgi:maleate isomerase